MAKQKEEPMTRDSFFASAISSAQEKFGDKDAYVASEHKVFGIPLDNLALMWLVDSNVWPLGRVTMTHGAEQSGKSAFLLWLEKLFIRFGGTGVYVSAENKDSPSLIRSLLGEEIKYVDYRRARTIQEWQMHVSHSIDHYREKQGESGGKFPMIIGVDSIAGVQDQSVKETVDKQGYADGRQYPVGAAAVTYYLQVKSNDLVGSPICLHCVNHAKQKIDGGQEKGQNLTAMSSRPAGASHLRFANSMDVWFKRGGDVLRADRKGFVANLRVYKSSLGDAHRAISVELSWKADKTAPGGQQTWWNWDQATADMLAAFKDSKKPGDKSSPIFDVLEGFTVNSKKYSCKRLGLVAVDGYELGAVINSDEVLLTECMEALNIHKYEIFTAGSIK